MKKGQGLSMNTIIIASLALLVLVILSLIFMSRFNEDVEVAENKSNYIPTETSCGVGVALDVSNWSDEGKFYIEDSRNESINDSEFSVDFDSDGGVLMVAEPQEPPECMMYVINDIHEQSMCINAVGIKFCNVSDCWQINGTPFKGNWSELNNGDDKR